MLSGAGTTDPHSHDAGKRRAELAERELYNLGITFTVYSDQDVIDRILPFDVIPRLLSPADWQVIETGSKQRVKALNLFLHDVYHDGRILKDGVVPAELVYGNAYYREQMRGVSVPHDSCNGLWRRSCARPTWSLQSPGRQRPDTFRRVRG